MSAKSVRLILRLVAAPLVLSGVALSQAVPRTVVRQLPAEQRSQVVPMVVEEWSTTATNAPPAGRAWPRFQGHFPGYVEAKRAANQRAQQSTGPTASPRSETPSPNAPQSLVVFDGPNGSNASSPPDPVIAAGPNQVLVAVNSMLAIYDKSGLQQGGFQALGTFFAGLHVSGEVFDPRVIYDPVDGRFILSAAEVDMSNFTNGHVLVAVSQTSNPAGGWYKFAFDSKGRNPNNTADTFPDAPGVGLDAHALYLTSNQFEFNAQCLSGAENDACTFSDAWITVIALPELLAGNAALNVTTFRNIQTASNQPAFGIQPALTYGSASAEFLVAASYTANPNNLLDLFSISTSGTPVLDAAELVVPTFSQPPDAPQGGSAKQIMTNDFRVLNAVWANDSLWAGQNVASPDGSSPVARWYQIQLSDLSTAGLAQSGEVSGSGAAYYPAISVKTDGTAGMAFSTSSPTLPVSAAFSARGPVDPPGAMSSFAMVRQGSGAYDAATERWGDYSGISLDPDGNSFWTIAEYAGTPDPHFGTAVARMGAPPSLAPDFSLMMPQTSASIHAGEKATYQLIGVATNGLAYPVTFDCSNLPAGASCSFSPASMILGGIPSTSTLTVSTGSSVIGSLRFIPDARITANYLLLASTAGSGMVGFVFLLSGPGDRRRWSAIFMLAVLMLLCVSCGGGGGRALPVSTAPAAAAQTTPPGTYAITVNAVAGGVLQHSLQITLTVN